MAAQVSVHSASHWWTRVTASAVLICLAQGSLLAQRGSARYIGGTLEPRPNIIQYRCRLPKGTLDLTSHSNLVFGDGERLSLTTGYDSITTLKYGLDAARGGFCYPWDSYEQFTKKRHYILTVVFRDAAGREQAVVFELDKGAVRPMLAGLETRTGKRVEFTDAVACIQYKTPSECDHGQPAELKGLTNVFIETSVGADRELIASQITASKLGLTLVLTEQEAEIVLRYTRARVAETRFGEFGANGGSLMNAGRGEVSVARDGRRRVLVMFEDIELSPLQKDPATNFGKAFVEAYRKAATTARR